jgi:hypothetical protein
MASCPNVADDHIVTVIDAQRVQLLTERCVPHTFRGGSAATTPPIIGNVHVRDSDYDVFERAG